MDAGLEPLRKFFPPGAPLRPVAARPRPAGRRGPLPGPRFPSVEEMVRTGVIWEIIRGGPGQTTTIDGHDLHPGQWRCIHNGCEHRSRPPVRLGDVKYADLHKARAHCAKHHSNQASSSEVRNVAITPCLCNDITAYLEMCNCNLEHCSWLCRTALVVHSSPLQSLLGSFPHTRSSSKSCVAKPWSLRVPSSTMK